MRLNYPISIKILFKDVELPDEECSILDAQERMMHLYTIDSINAHYEEGETFSEIRSGGFYFYSKESASSIKNRLSKHVTSQLYIINKN